MEMRVSRFSITLILLLVLRVSLSHAASNGVLPDSLSAAIITRVLSFETSSVKESELRIHVFDSESLSREFQGLVGVRIGDRKLGRVSFGALGSDEKVDVVIASGQSAMVLALEYAERNGAISVSNNPKLAKMGVSLVVFDDEGLPGILLSRNGAKREGLYWNPEILKIARMANE